MRHWQHWQASTVIVPMACSTRLTAPAARSAGAASSDRRPKLAAVRVESSVEAGSRVMSAMVRSTLPRSPWLARWPICRKLPVSASFRQSPSSVPPHAAAAQAPHGAALFRPEEGRPGPWWPPRPGPGRRGQRPGAAGGELIDLGSGEPKVVHIAGANAGEDHPLHLPQ